MSRNYGLSYMGSKNAIAMKIMELFPSAETFVDLFAGGCAMTHAAMVSGKFRRFICNDITDAPRLFVDAVNGKYSDEKRWISRDDFFRLKDSDPYVRICWSFGNNQIAYMYGKEIEPWKKALHYARVFGDFSLFRQFGIETDGSSDDIRNNADEYAKRYARWYITEVLGVEYKETFKISARGKMEKEECERLRLYLVDALKKSGLTQSEVGRRLGTQMEGHYFGRSQWGFPTLEHYTKMQEFLPLKMEYYECVPFYIGESLQRLESLESLQRLQRLQSMQSSCNVDVFQRDYREIEFTDNAVIYCDPPYKSTAEYLHGFDHGEFYRWLLSHDRPIFVSEYAMPEGFTCISEIGHRSRLSGSANNKVTEKVFVQTSQLDKVRKDMWTLF